MMETVFVAKYDKKKCLLSSYLLKQHGSDRTFSQIVMLLVNKKYTQWMCEKKETFPFFFRKNALCILK